ncbi:MAG: hypothetical protein ABSH46_08970 [Bryobacteraceae bacterium]|jgi:hypothetical protein
MVKLRIVATVFGALLLVGAGAIAQKPAENVSPGRHPNLAAAQRLSHQAWQKVLDAQQANEWDMNGHAQKAKDLLDQANQQLKLAAQAANRNAH